MSTWTHGRDSRIYRFEKHKGGELKQVVEIEIYVDGVANVRLIDQIDDELVSEHNCDSLVECLKIAEEKWGLNADSPHDNGIVQIDREVLNMLADHVGTEVVFGHNVPVEIRDALAAAYEALDHPGLPMSFYDCPHDGASLVPGDGGDGKLDNKNTLHCPECGRIYHRDPESGDLTLN